MQRSFSFRRVSSSRASQWYRHVHSSVSHFQLAAVKVICVSTSAANLAAAFCSLLGENYECNSCVVLLEIFPAAQDGIKCRKIDRILSTERRGAARSRNDFSYKFFRPTAGIKFAHINRDQYVIARTYFITRYVSSFGLLKSPLK